MYPLSLVIVFFIALLVECLCFCSWALHKATNPVAGLVHALRVVLAYLVMLALMSFNIGVLLVAVVDHALGFFLLGSHAFKRSDHDYEQHQNGYETSNARKRLELYDKMAEDLDDYGPHFLEAGERATSQTLSLTDIFSLKNEYIRPILKVASPLVLANVLYLDPEYAEPLSKAVKNVFNPYFDKGEVTSDPVTIRGELRKALPRAPKKQLYDPVLHHTSFARVLGSLNVPSQGTGQPPNLLTFSHELVGRINKEIRGFEAVVSELWYVEFDVLALALDGRLKAHKFHLGCPRT